MLNERACPVVRVDCLVPEFAVKAEECARRLGLPMEGEADFSLQFAESGWQLLDLSAGAPGPVRVDFVEGVVAHRRQFGGGGGQMIAKAVGIQAGVRPSVLDATAGLGRDAFLLASLGCEMRLIERQPIIAVLLEDGLQRALANVDIAAIATRMHLISGDAIAGMRNWDGDVPQVVYLDPMFPHRDKSALVKKEMRLFRPLVGDDDDAPALLEAALALASHRVVVKRPRKAPAISSVVPSYCLEGKSSRFDIYAKRSLKAV